MSKIKVKDFLELLNSQVNKAIYVWGGDGENLSAMNDPEDWIERKETSKSNRDRALKLYRKRVADGVKDIRAMDCSGMVYWALKTLGAKIGDTSSRGFYGMGTPISKEQLKAGDLGFHYTDKDGDGFEQSEITHVGVYDGKRFIEARGRDYGVVNTRTASSFHRFCRLEKYLDYAEEQAAPAPAPAANCKGKYEFTRLLKYGSTGEDVIELKRLLIAHGYTKGITVDTKNSVNFRSSTKSLVKAFQKAQGLSVDGKAGKDTITALGGVWKG